MNETTRRKGFVEWLERQAVEDKKKLPLTHITKAILAEDIIRSGNVTPTRCDVFKRSIAYFFYGRPAYRVGGDGAIKSEAACPVCFIFRPELISDASMVFPFDTGAFANRMYKSHMLEEMHMHDFEVDPKKFDPSTLVAAIFPTVEDYVQGNLGNVSLRSTEPWEFHARALMDLIISKGRNEPDDRVFSVEIHIETDVSLNGNLMAVIVPHTLWSATSPTPWLTTLEQHNIAIETYPFTSHKHPEYYQAQIEGVVISLYKKWQII